MEFLLWPFVLVFSLLVLIKAADFFTLAAEKIGLALGIDEFIIGVTILAVGTSLPELVASIIAVFENASEIVVSNVIGSNIANIFLILGFSAIVGKKLTINYELAHVDLPLLVGSGLLMAVMIWDLSYTWPEAVLSLLGLIVYLHYSLQSKKQATPVDATPTSKMAIPSRQIGWKTLGTLVLSGGLIYLGAEYTIKSIIHMSTILKIGTEFIAASAIAVGTSLPELMVSVAAAKKGKSELAVGNILGSNIFNAFAVMGIPGLMGTLTIPVAMRDTGLVFMLIATFLFFFIAHEKEVTAWEGWLLLIFYVLFLGKLFIVF